jgi:hypothetical protein
MIFEVGDLKVTAPLDPSEGKRYTESVRENDMDNFYNLTTRMEDYVKPTMGGVLVWGSFSSCTSDSKACLENWQQRMYEVSTRRCAHINQSLRWIGTKLYEPPRYEGLTDINVFIKSFELHVPE